MKGIIRLVLSLWYACPAVLDEADIKAQPEINTTTDFLEPIVDLLDCGTEAEIE